MRILGLRELLAKKGVHPFYVIPLILLFAIFSGARAQSAAKLQILLPGMTAAPGTPSGYTGTPYTQTSGVPFQIIVNATDANWNVVNVSDLVSISSSDPFANLPPNTFLNNGSATLTITLNTQGSHTLTAADLTNPNVLDGLSPSFDVAEVLFFTVSDIGDPWYTQPGQVTVGDDVPQVEIIARDAQGNRVQNYNKIVALSENTDYGPGRITPETVQLTGGKWKGSIRIFRAGLKQQGVGVTGDVWVQVSDANIIGTSNRFCALPRPYSKIITLAPGQTYIPGSITGKSGMPNDQQANNQFYVDVYTTDEYWNQIRDYNTSIAFSSSDPSAILPSSSVLSNGHLTAPARLNTPGNQTITGVDDNNPAIPAGTSSPIRVISQELHHFELSSVSSPQVAGQPFQVTITAVNSLGNPIPNYGSNLNLTASTGIETIIPQQINMNNGAWTGQLILTRASQYVTVNVSDMTIPPHTGSSNQFTVVPGQAAKLQILVPGETATPGVAPGKSGVPDEALAGSGFYVRVNAVDEWWNLIPGNTDVMHLTSSDPAASLPANAPLSGGTRQFSVTLNTNGLQTISASDVSHPAISAGNSGAIWVNPGNMDHFVFDPITGPKFVGTPFSITISAVDPLGNPITAYSGVVHLSVSTGTNTIIPVTANFNNGTWTGNVILKVAAGGVYLIASDGATPQHTGTSNQFEVQPGPLSQFQVIVPGLAPTPGISPGYSGTPQGQNAGQPFPIVVNGVDDYWNVVTTASDSFGVSSTDLYASLPDPTRLVGGTRSLSITLNSGGSHTVSAFHLSNPSIQNGQTPPISVTPQNLDHFSFNTIAGQVTAGAPLSITVEAKTADDHTVFGFNGTISISASTGTGTVQPTSIGPFVNGVWSGDIQLTKAASDVTLQVTDNGTPAHSGASNPFTVLPGNFVKLQILLPGEAPNPGIAPGKTGTPLDQQTGQQFDVLVRAVDAYWNKIPSAVDSIKLASSDTNAIFTPRSKLINGAASLTIIMGTAGMHTVSVEDITNPSILAAVSSAFHVYPGNLDHFEFATINNQTAGDAFSITVTASDVAGNPVAGYNGHARLESSTGNSTFAPNEIDFVDGIWTGNFTITRSGDNVKLTCTDYAATPHSGQSNLFNVAAGQFTSLQILLPGENATPGISPGKTGQVNTQVAGDAIPVTVNAVDAWWNTVISINGTVGLTSTDPAANLPLDAALQSGTRTFNDVRLNTPGYWTLTAHYRTDPQISSDTSPLVHVISGSVASFSFESITSPQTAGDTIQVTIHAVDGSGTTVPNYNEMASITASTGPGTIIVGDVQFSNGSWSGPLVVTKADQSVHLNIHDFDDVVRGNSNPFTVVADVLSRLQILAPGEAASPGLAPGKTGTPDVQISGIPFSARLRATDAWWNAAGPESLNVHFSSSDAVADLPVDTILTSNTTSFEITFLSPGNNFLAVQVSGNPALSDTSSTVTVQSGALDHFVFSQIDSGQIAGQPFNIKIQAFNSYNYSVTDYQGDIILSASTGNGTITRTGVTMNNGVWQGDLAVTRADTQVVLYAADYVPAPNTHTGYSNGFAVEADSLAGLQVLLPGETPTAGVSPGKIGEPDVHAAGTTLLATVRAVDAYWNLIPARNDSLSLSLTDTFAVVPDHPVLENGRAQIPVTPRAAGNHLLTAAFKDNSGFSPAVSDTLEITPNAYSQLLVLLPGESILPGDTENDPLKTPGRQNNPVRQTSGLAFPAEVYAVDDFWNPVVSAPADQIHLFTTDNTAEITSQDSTLVNGVARFSVTLHQGGNQIIRGINDSNTGIRTSLDAMLEVLVGGLHYEIILGTNKVDAGEPFEMQVYFKNGIGETVPSANQVVSLSAVDAQNVEQVVGTVGNASFNLQGGQRTIQQTCSSVGLIRIKIEDDNGTDPGYSDPIEILAGSVTEISMTAPKAEIRGLEEMNLAAKLLDVAGNPVPEQEVKFEVIEGSGKLDGETALSNASGIASVKFTAGKLTETNIVRVSVDSVSHDLEIIVNLAPSTMPDGKPINYPNPFGVESEITHIDYYLPIDADVTLQIFDLFGNLVWTKKIAAGEAGGKGRTSSSHPNSVVWGGVNDRGQRVGNGGYILLAKATANGKTVMNAKRKIAVLR